MARGENGGRSALELVVLGVVLAAISLPLSVRFAWARGASDARHSHASSVAREVLAHAAARPLALLAAEFRARDAEGLAGRMHGHRVLGPKGRRRNPLALPEELVRDIDASGLEVRVYFQWDRSAPFHAGCAWVDVLDADATADPLAALLAHRSRMLARRGA